jgi:hypothetical protein
MTRIILTVPMLGILLNAFAAAARAQYGAAVISYDAGTTPASGLTTPSVAVGESERFTGEGVFPGVVSTFNPPFRANEIVSVGEGGHITLRLSHYALPLASGPEIGVFENVGLVFNPTTGGAGPTVATFGQDSAIVEVSADGLNWISLGNVHFTIPANGYADATDPFASTPGSVPSDFQQPFTGGLSSFNGLPYSNATGPDILELLAGSGGGTWLDISNTGLSQVGFIRFSLADDLDANSRLNFELDAVSIAHGAVGATVPEPETIVWVPFTIVVIAINWPRRSHHAAAGPGRS